MTVGNTFVGANIFMLLCVGSEQLFELSLVGNASETTSFFFFPVPWFSCVEFAAYGRVSVARAINVEFC